MKLLNSTDWPTHLLRRMVAWCCQELGLPPSKVKQARFGNSKSAYGGIAYLCYGKIGVRVGKASRFPTITKIHRNGTTILLEDREECLVHVTAHELAHLMQYREGSRTRGTPGSGGSEMSTDWHAKPVFEKFREQRHQLMTAWVLPPVCRYRPPAKSLVQVRTEKATRDLGRWMLKLRLAQTKVRKLRKKVRYYQRKHGQGTQAEE